jgi:hypothetical protein
MMPIEEGATVLMPPAALTGAGTAEMSFSKVDSRGVPYDSALVIVHGKLSHTSGDAPSAINLAESDTATSPTSMTDIVAFTGGTATGTSVGYVLPTAAAWKNGTTVEFQIDLRKRKKYIGLELTGGTHTSGGVYGAVIKLYRAKESAETAAHKSAVVNNSNTSATSQCGVVVRD